MPHLRQLKAEADAPLDTAAADARLDREVDEADWLLAEAEVFNREFPNSHFDFERRRGILQERAGPLDINSVIYARTH